MVPAVRSSIITGRIVIIKKKKKKRKTKQTNKRKLL